MAKKTLIISDLHLGAANARTDAQLAALELPFDRLIVNGDLVDNYDFRRFRPGCWAVLNRLRAVAKERELILVRGNHDYPYPLSADPNSRFRLLEQTLQTAMADAYDLRVGLRRYLVLHGDRFDDSLNLTRVGHAAEAVYRGVQRVHRGAACWLKAASKLVCGVVEQVKQRAVAHAKAHQYQGVIAGHTHFCADESVGTLRYLNSGSWVEDPCNYLWAEGSEITLMAWPELPESLESSSLASPAVTDGGGDQLDPALIGIAD